MEQELPEIKLDETALYREENYSDRRVGAIRKLVPVTADGSDDPSRPVVFEGQASLMTPAGALPLHFELEAASLDEALEQFPAAAQAALENTLEELEKMRRDQQSSILVPGAGGGQGGGMGPGMGGPGMGGPGLRR